MHLTTVELWKQPSHVSSVEAGRIVCNFLDVATTSFGRATHYNTREEQQVAELHAHDALLSMSRDLYAIFMALPGTLDRAVQIGLKKLLGTERNGVPEQLLLPWQEREILYHMMQALPAQRMLKLIDALRIGNEELGLRKANNARTRKMILRTLLGSSRLELWAVKYRSKVKRALIHAWGQRLASVIREIVNKKPGRWSDKEKGIMHKNVYRFSQKTNFGLACDCIQFVFTGKCSMYHSARLPLITAFGEAKRDLKKGSKLPPEVLEGIRSTFHKDVPKEKIIEITKDSMTNIQRLHVQKRAKEAGVEVEMDPLNYDAVQLYIYAFECGLNDEISQALYEKARRSAKAFPARYERVGIVVDMSKSMEGDKTQPLRPAATALAMRDMLVHTAEHGVTEYVGGGGDPTPAGSASLVRPLGDTALADALVRVLQKEPEAVFVISDGYENAPAGRFAEVMRLVREAGINTPIYHLNPVMAAESRGIRELAADEGVPTLPVQNPKALATTFVRGLIETDPIRGINSLLQVALKVGPSATGMALLQE